MVVYELVIKRKALEFLNALLSKIYPMLSVISIIRWTYSITVMLIEWPFEHLLRRRPHKELHQAGR